MDHLKDSFEQCGAHMERGSRFVLTTHLNPDGDGIGSEIALAHYLRAQGKHVDIINHSATPAQYDFLDPDRGIILYEPQYAPLFAQADVIVILDANQSSRLGDLASALMKSAATKIVIDHHLDREGFADLYLVDESSAATGKILYELLSHLRAPLTPAIAQGLYSAIMTDTGSFRFPKTDASIHRIVAHLIESGADPVQIHEAIYDRGSTARLRLLGKALSGLQTTDDQAIAYLLITRDMFRESGADESDTDVFVNYTLSINAVQIGFMITELPRGIKVSFRSKGAIAINELAKEFGGGGHRNAAGARIENGSTAEVLPRLLKRAQSYLPQ